jgi:serine protease
MSRRSRCLRISTLAVTTLLGVVAGLMGSLVAPAPVYGDWIRASQWQLASLHAAAAWRYGRGAGVVVAVLDSGVDARHPDLAGQVLPGADFVDGSTDGRTDFVGHGTTVAALIAGRDDDKDGVTGLAPRAKILPVRVLDRANRYSDASTVAAGLRWAVDHGATVVNMSLGGANRSAVLAEAIDYARRHDVVVVACTGNVSRGGPTQVWYPAREPGVVAVAGMASSPHGDTLWRGGLTGAATALTAPAYDLLGARPGGYWRVQGTSFAAPLVTATAALVRSRWPGMDAPNVVNRLVRTAHDLGAPGRDRVFGYGEVDPLRALSADVAAVHSSPLGAGIHSGIGAVDPSGWAGSEGGQGGPVDARVTSLTTVRDAAHAAEARRAALALLVLLLAATAGLLVLRRRAAPGRDAAPGVPSEEPQA